MILDIIICRNVARISLSLSHIIEIELHPGDEIINISLFSDYPDEFEADVSPSIILPSNSA
jgi:hypothetical protein